MVSAKLANRILHLLVFKCSGTFGKAESRGNSWGRQATETETFGLHPLDSAGAWLKDPGICRAG